MRGPLAQYASHAHLLGANGALDALLTLAGTLGRCRDRNMAGGMVAVQRITAGRVVQTQRAEAKAQIKNKRTEMNMYMRQNINRNLPKNVRSAHAPQTPRRLARTIRLSIEPVAVCSATHPHPPAHVVRTYVFETSVLKRSCACGRRQVPY